MDANSYLFIATGLILALAGFGYYAIEVWKAYNEEKRKIEEDFTLSKQYEPGRSMGSLMAFLMVSSASLMYVLVMALLLSIVGDDSSLPLASDLVAKFIMLMGATSLIGNIARIPNARDALRDMAYYPALPDSIKDAMNAEKDLNKKYEIMDKYVEENGLKKGRWYFGKYMVINMLPETNNLYIFMITDMLLIFTGLMRTVEKVQDISPGFSSTMFATGVLFVVLAIPSIFFMKKSADIEMNENNFGKKILVAVYGFAPGIIGLVIMLYAMLPLLE